MYALVKLDDIKETFNFDEFDAALFFYRYYENIDKKYKSKQKKQKKQKRNRGTYKSKDCV
jgi:hypothetical protein